MILDELAARMEGSTSRQLARAVTLAIRDCVLSPGSKLPPIRAIAKHLQLSPTTVSAAWSLLRRSGTIQTDGRRGTVVTDLAAPVAARYRRVLDRQTAFPLDLATGIPDHELLPDYRAALRGLTVPATPTSYLDDPVLPELRARLLEEWPYQAPSLTVTDGAMDAFDLLCQASLRVGDRVALEAPSFPSMMDLLDSIGVDVVGVPVDDEGLSVDELRGALAQGVAAVVIQPRAQNPTGISMTLGRARAIARLLRETEVLVIEDDSSGAISSAPALSLGRWIPAQTIHIKSFSKSHGPDLRLATVSGPAEIIAAVEDRRHLGQGWSSRLLQGILANLLKDEGARQQVIHARLEYARRLRLLVDQLAEQKINVRSRDGINVWVPVHDEAAATVRLAAHGIGVAPGRPFATTRDQHPHIRVSAGLVRENHKELAQLLALAAHTAQWRSL